MSEPQIPEDVRMLLYALIRTYEQLEAIILMHGAPNREWTQEEVADALKISVESAADALRELASGGIVEMVELPGRLLHYRGPRDDLKLVVGRLAQVYEQGRLQVITQMSKNAIERMNTLAMRAFADAFVIGKKPKDG